MFSRSALFNSTTKGILKYFNREQMEQVINVRTKLHNLFVTAGSQSSVKPFREGLGLQEQLCQEPLAGTCPWASPGAGRSECRHSPAGQ